jgi:hypothetical protein
MCLADGELDGVRCGGDEDVDALLEILDALQEIALVKEAMIHGDIEATVRFGVEQAVQAIVFHRFRLKDPNLLSILSARRPIKKTAHGK